MATGLSIVRSSAHSFSGNFEVLANWEEFTFYKMNIQMKVSVLTH